MNQPEFEKQNEIQQNDEYIVRRSRRADIIAVVVCLLLSLFVWIAVMNSHDSDHIALELQATSAEYDYALSSAHLEVEGTVAALRHAKVIKVNIPVDAPGVYHLDETNLLLPDGVQLTSSVELTLTITRK